MYIYPLSFPCFEHFFFLSGQRGLTGWHRFFSQGKSVSHGDRLGWILLGFYGDFHGEVTKSPSIIMGYPSDNYCVSSHHKITIKWD